MRLACQRAFVGKKESLPKSSASPLLSRTGRIRALGRTASRVAGLAVRIPACRAVVVGAVKNQCDVCCSSLVARDSAWLRCFCATAIAPSTTVFSCGEAWFLATSSVASMFTCAGDLALNEAPVKRQALLLTEPLLDERHQLAVDIALEIHGNRGWHRSRRCHRTGRNGRRPARLTAGRPDVRTTRCVAPSGLGHRGGRRAGDAGTGRSIGRSASRTLRRQFGRRILAWRRRNGARCSRRRRRATRSCARCGWSGRGAGAAGAGAGAAGAGAGFGAVPGAAGADPGSPR